MISQRSLLIAAACLLVQSSLLISPAQALNLNDPVAEVFGGIENYWDKANRFPAVGSLYAEWHHFPEMNASNCSGTLINSRTVLTAAHCAPKDDLYRYAIRFSPDAHLQIEHDRVVVGFKSHELYNDKVRVIDDIAIVSLDRPVTAISPVDIFHDPRALAFGDLVLFSGYGLSGTGSKPGVIADSKRRVGEGRLSAFDEAEFITILESQFVGCDVDECQAIKNELIDGFKNRLITEFRDPLSPSKHDQSKLTEKGYSIPYLQAGPSYGDSGGPLFIRLQGGQYAQIAILSYGNKPEDNYGSFHSWTPLYLYFDWLAENNPLRKTTSTAGAFAWSDTSAWLDTLGRNEVPNNVDGDPKTYSSLGRYYDVTIGDGSSITLDRDVTIDSLDIAGSAAMLDIAPANALTTIVDTRLLDGALRVDGRLTTERLILSKGVMDGVGTITTTNGVHNIHATIAPGRRDASGAITPGVLTIQGPFVQYDKGTLMSALGRGGAGRLDVEGAALLGGTLHVSGAPDRYDPQRWYQALFATQGIHGRFDAVTDELVFLDPAAVTYSDYDAGFRLARNQTPFAAYADNGNAASVARSLETLSIENGVYQDLMRVRYATPALDALSRSLSLLTGEVQASAVSVVYGDAGSVRDTVLQRLRSPLAAPSQPLAPVDESASDPLRPVKSAKQDFKDLDPQRFALWGTGLGGWGHWRGDDRSARLNTSGSGFLIGAEATPDQNLRLGVAGGYMRTTFDIDNRLSSGSNEAVFGAIYGAGSIGQYQIRLGASYAHNDIATRRSVVLPGFSDAPSASRGADALQVFGELGYEINVGNGIRIEPFISGSFLRVNADRFAEYGRDAALFGASQTYELGTAMLAIRGEARLSDAMPLTARGLIGWRAALGDVRPDTQLSFVQGSEAFFVSGVPVDRSALVIEAGLDWRFDEALTIGASVGGQVGAKNQSLNLKGNLVWRF